MKKIILSLAVVASAFLYSCGGGSSSNPTEVAKSFLTSLNKMDYDAAKKLGTEDTKKMLEMTSTLSAMVPDSVKKLTANKKVDIIGEPVLEGDKATVTYKESDSPEEKKLTLLKKDGKWLVQQTKDNPEAGTPAPTDEMQGAKDETVPMAADSTKRK